jgi:hypothetical protein
MTQSLLNNGIEGNSNDRLNATPKWVCGTEFKPRPENNYSGASRVEKARKKTDGTQMLVVYSKDRNSFIDYATQEEYTRGALEIKITEIK